MAEEKSFENKVKNYLDSIGAWYVKYWAGAKFTKEGIPDILACIAGRFYGIEVKAANGKPSLIQLVTLRKIRASGGIGVLLYPKDFDDFKSFIRTGEQTWYQANIAMQTRWFQKLKE